MSCTRISRIYIILEVRRSGVFAVDLLIPNLKIESDRDPRLERLQKFKTYNSGNSLIVTDPATIIRRSVAYVWQSGRDAQFLHSLWSYVLEMSQI